MDTVEFRVSPRAHIVVDGDQCRGCSTRACVVACPANLFVPDGRRRHPLQLRAVLRVRHLLPRLQHGGGAISWTYPEGGRGVVFKRS